MKTPYRFFNTFAAAIVSAALGFPAAADVSVVKPEDASKHFAAVSKHLELGGLFFTYVDIDGDIAGLAAMGDKFIDIARRELPDIPKNLSAGKIVDALGLTCVKAVGMSSRSAGKDFYHNRALLYMPEGPKGLMKLFGGKAAPFAIASFAPADAGAAIQLDLDLSSLLETIEAVLKAGGQDAFLNQYKAGLSMPVPGLNMTAGELIGKLNTRILATIRIDESKKLKPPGAPFEIPGVQAMVALDNIDFLIEPLLGLIADKDGVAVDRGEDYTIIRPDSSLPGDLGYFQPGLYHDKKNKRIILTSHLELAKAAGKGNTLGSSEDFKKAMTGLPSEGNGLSYATPKFVQQFFDFYKRVIHDTVKDAKAPAALESLVNGLFDLFPVPAQPIAAIHANVPEGMLFMSNASENHKHTIVQAAAMPLLFVAAGLGAYRASSTERAERQPAPLERADDGDAPVKAVKNNLQQIAFSAQTYFIDNPKAKDVTYEKLVKAELIFELDPVAGESYKGLTLKRTGGEISVKTKAGDAVHFKYQAASE